jgi:aminoglycoside phosphotransferase (APT) family kinase protein
MNDGEGMRDRVGALLARALGAGVTVTAVDALTGGASSATYSVRAEVDGAPQRFVLQANAAEGGLGLSRATMAAVQRRAGALGVPVAEVIAVAEPGDGLGDAAVSAWVDGEALAPRWLKGDGFAAAREALTAQVGAALARLHAAPLSTWEGIALRGGSAADLLAGSFDMYRRIGTDVPAYDLAFAWLRPRMGDGPATCLVHGDFRSGNFLVDAQGLAAVLDWELTHLSVPAEDLGWMCVQAWRFGRWDKPVGGFGTRGALLEAYAAAGGTPIDPEELRVWEVYGNLKWGLSCLQLGHDHLSGRVPSVERAAIGRRVSEVAADLAFLLRRGDL